VGVLKTSIFVLLFSCHALGIICYGLVVVEAKNLKQLTREQLAIIKQAIILSSKESHDSNDYRMSQAAITKAKHGKKGNSNMEHTSLCASIPAGPYMSGHDYIGSGWALIPGSTATCATTMIRACCLSTKASRGMARRAVPSRSGRTLCVGSLVSTTLLKEPSIASWTWTDNHKLPDVSAFTG
jgi:hypothetical protein